MAVKAGYKQTEVGVIPEDWKVIKLGDWAAFKTGPFGTALHKSDYTNDGIPVINPMHIIDGYLVPTKSMTITEEAAKKLSDFRLKRRDIVIGRRGDMGRCAVIQENQAGWLCGSGSMIIRCAENLGPEFLQRVLSSPRVVAAIEDTSVGSTMTNLNQSVLANLKIQFPPTKAEQQAIAEALSDVDGLISALDALIAKKRAIKQGAMQELLTGQRRLPGFAGEWAVRSLDSLGGRGRPAIKAGPFGSSLTKDKYVAEGYKVYGQEQVIRGDYLYGDYFIPKTLFDELRSCAVEPGDILLSLVGTAGRVLVIPNGAPEGIINPRLIRFSFDQTIMSAHFFQYLFETEAYQALLARSAQGGTMGVLNASLLRPICIPVPSLTEQTAIAQLLADLDGELAALAAKRAKTVAVKAGMMQTLLTGQVRLV